MSIAAERWDYQYSGGYQADGSSGYKQNQAGFYQKNASGSQNIGRFQQAPNLNTQNSSYGQSQHNLRWSISTKFEYCTEINSWTSSI
jgi:hypothetical protein